MLKRDYSLIKNKKMKKNLGTIDKLVRILIAAVIAILFFANIITGALGIALLLFAVILVVTSFINFCPIYFAFGLSSNKKKS
jgi:amino acid transporter